MSVRPTLLMAATNGILSGVWEQCLHLHASRLLSLLLFAAFLFFGFCSFSPPSFLFLSVSTPAPPFFPPFHSSSSLHILHPHFLVFVLSSSLSFPLFMPFHLPILTFPDSSLSFSHVLMNMTLSHVLSCPNHMTSSHVLLSSPNEHGPLSCPLKS